MAQEGLEMVHAAGMIAITIEGMVEDIDVEMTMITRETAHLTDSSVKK